MLLRYKNQPCVICHMPVVAPNLWVKYHISYEPQLVIMACKYCNMIERLLRTDRSIPFQHIKRSRDIIKYHAKFKIKL